MDGILTSDTIITFGGILILLQISSLAINIWSKIRRSPPIDQTLSSYVRKVDFDRETDALRANDREIYNLIRKLTDDHNNSNARRDAELKAWQIALERQLGRIESAIEGIRHDND